MPELTPLDDNRQEHFLNGEDLEPITRREHFYAGRESELPAGHQEPETREEWFIQKYRGGGGDVTVVPLSVTENGTYSEEGKAYSPVNVNVPLPTNAYMLKSVNTPTPIASFDDGEEMVMPSLKVAIEPQQDLHGYDYPWVGGAGKNKCNPNINEWNNLTYKYIKLPNFNDDNYIMSFVDKDTSVDLTGINFGFMHNYPDESTQFRWVIINEEIQSDKTNISQVDRTTKCDTLIIYPNTQSAFEKIFARFNVQVEKGTTATTFAPYSNICPISGWTEADVTRTGKNLVESTLANTTINNVGEINVSGGSSTFDMHIAKIIKGETYTIQSDESQNVNQKFVGGFFYDVPQLGSISYNNARLANTPATFTAPIDGYVAFRTSHNYTFAQIELGSTATTYEPYAGTTYTIDLDGTRYGGKLDVISGVLTVDRAYVDLGTLTWTTLASGRHSAFIGDGKFAPTNTDIANALSSQYMITSATDIPNIDSSFCYGANGVANLLVNDSRYNGEDASDFKTHMNGVQLVYELAAPLTIQLTPTAVKSLLGTNNIWADTGDITDAEYFSKEV